DRHGLFARTERFEDVGEPMRRRVAIARDLQPLRKALAEAREVVNRLRDDAHALQLALVAHPLHDADIGRNELILAQQITRAVERFVVDENFHAAVAVVERDERHLAAPAGLHAKRRYDAGDQYAVGTRL